MYNDRFIVNDKDHVYSKVFKSATDKRAIDPEAEPYLSP